MRLKRIIIITLFLLAIGTMYVYAAGSFSISSNKTTLEIGQTATITITGTGATGQITVASSDSSVLTVGTSKVWVENNSATVTVTAKGAGSAKITATATDLADSSTAEEITGAKNVTITVNKKEEEKPAPSTPVPTTTETPATTEKPATNTQTPATTEKPATNTQTPATTEKPATSAPAPVKTKSSNANLRNLGIRPNDFNNFKPGNTSYTVSVPNEVDAIEVYASKAESVQTITGTGSNKKLNEGSNKFDVTVTAEDGTKKTYTITVIRLAKEEVNNPDIEQAPEVKVALTSLSIEGVKLNEPFTTDVTEYTGIADENIEKVNVKTTANIPNAEVLVAGAEELTEGENTITIRVKSPNGNDEKVYVVKVTKEAKKEEENEENKNEIAPVVGMVDSSSNVPPVSGNKMTTSKWIFSISIGSIAFFGIIFAIVYYKRSNSLEEDDDEFAGNISRTRAIKDAAVATSRLARANTEEVEETSGNRRGRRFK